MTRRSFLGLLGAATAVSPPPSLPPPPHVHDPVMAQEGGVWYVFSTGRGIPVFASRDRQTWTAQGRVFSLRPAWVGDAVPGAGDSLWAPDISFGNGLWHLYYAASTFGSNVSAIGLATSPTLDRSRADFGWHDRGTVLCSHHGDAFNAIDPNVVQDTDGRAWLAFGSFWGGLKLVPLDKTTGKPPVPCPPPVPLAFRPTHGGAIEAPFVFYRAPFFYLFASFDLCCRGVQSTYNLRVGRSASVTGPYADRAGVPMMQGGGTLLLSGSARWRGPGHCAVVRDGLVDWLVYHAYDADDNGTSRLRIEPLAWDAGRVAARAVAGGCPVSLARIVLCGCAVGYTGSDARPPGTSLAAR